MTDHTTHPSSDEIPYGYCQCGCGSKTTIAPFDDKAHGAIKGEPRQYILGHSRRVRGIGSNPTGLCMCGCGQKTRIAPQTNTAKGWIKGQPVSYISGHNNTPHRSTLAEMFWLYCYPGAPEDCWFWHGPTDKGYGVFKWQNKKYAAHRVAYELHYGPIIVGENPHDTSICHTCDQPTCINWAHLFLGTQSQNTLDMISKGRHADLKGELNGVAKLTDSDVLEIRRLFRDGKSQRAIAKRLKITPANVHIIVHNKGWTHLP